MENKLVGAKQLGMEALKGQPGGALGCWMLLCCAGGGDVDLVEHCTEGYTHRDR